MDRVKVYENLNQIYQTDSLEKQTDRYKEVTRQFLKEYNQKPTFFVRAPGRVNIIGEHVDYMLYPVLPFAVERDIIFAIGFSEEKQIINLRNTSNEKYPGCVINVSQELQSFDKEGQQYWLNYVTWGYKAACSLLGQSIPGGVNILVSADLPPASGLSSSSALTTASCVSFLLTYTKSQILPQQDQNAPQVRTVINQFTKAEIAVKVWEFEVAGGMAGGKMDQMISVGGEKGIAKLIHFHPDIQMVNVSIPEDYCFVVANSNVSSPKMLTLGKRYNCRVSECRLGVYIICKNLNLERQKTLRNLQDKIGCNLAELKEIVKKYLKPEGYTIKEMNEVCLSLFSQELSQTISDIAHSDLVMSQNEYLHPYKRLLHVVEETERVLNFSQCNDPIMLGTLMNQSHESCKNLFECSCPELDQLVETSLQSGAIGARLTGAGWGGCIVAFVSKQEKERLLQSLHKFYNESLKIFDNLNEFFFCTPVGNGACGFDPSLSEWFLA